MSMTFQRSEGRKLGWKTVLNIGVITAWTLMKLIHPMGQYMIPSSLMD
jgi:hypothetical protein